MIQVAGGVGVGTSTTRVRFWFHTSASFVFSVTVSLPNNLRTTAETVATTDNPQPGEWRSYAVVPVPLRADGASFDMAGGVLRRSTRPTLYLLTSSSSSSSSSSARLYEHSP